MFRSRRKESKDYFIRNGAAVLEHIIRNFNGDCNPIRCYSAQELITATNNFQLKMHSDSDYTLYQGIHQNRQIAVKKFFHPNLDRSKLLEFIANDIAIASRMSNHKNVLKLLGCCLETEFPILVYEFPESGNLDKWLFDPQAQDKLSWDQKLTIVIKIANSIAYLHHGLPNTFIHRDIKPRNIFLDRDLCPKLFDFQLALRIPEGETHVEENVVGTLFYLDPQAYRTGRFTDKSDVYGFGALLCNVLAEKRISYMYKEAAFLEDSLNPRIALDDFEEYCGDYLEDERTRVQVMEYVNLMKRCLRSKQEDRPDMIEAEKELRRIKNL